MNENIPSPCESQSVRRRWVQSAKCTAVAVLRSTLPLQAETALPSIVRYRYYVLHHDTRVSQKNTRFWAGKLASKYTVT